MNFEQSRHKNHDPSQEITRFAYRFFQKQGAELEMCDSGFEALLPENLSKTLKISEHVFINSSADRITDQKTDKSYIDQHPANYGSSLLEKMVNHACGRVPVLSCKLRFDYLKSQGFNKLIKNNFSFSGAKCKVESHATVKTDYILLTCGYLAQSDEQKEEMVKLVFNLETGVCIQNMANTFSLAVMDYKINNEKAIFGNEQIKTIVKCLKIEINEAITKKIDLFQASMIRRFKRDIKNLKEYYSSLKREMEKNLERPGLSKQLVEERKEKITLLPDELKRKGDDLFNKYRIKVKVAPCSIMLINTPAIKILCNAFVGKKTKNLSLLYNPVTKSIDPLICDGCGHSITNIHFCDNLHTLCPVCGAKCPVCRLLST